MRNARARFWIAAILGSAVWLAALLAGGANTAFDEGFRQSFYASKDVETARIAAFISMWGRGVVLIAITLAAALFLYFHRRIRAALLLITVFGGRLLVELQKLIIDRARPGANEHLEAVNSTSFPSAHAANSMITFVTIALLVPVGQRNRAIAVALAVVASLLTGWTRVALGVHWPTDVIGGWAFGLLWVAICMRLASRTREGGPST